MLFELIYVVTKLKCVIHAEKYRIRIILADNYCYNLETTKPIVKIDYILTR